MVNIYKKIIIIWEIARPPSGQPVISLSACATAVWTYGILNNKSAGP